MRSSSLLLLVFVGSIAVGQVSVTAGPTLAPIGGPIAITIANDTTSVVTFGNPCPFQVRDALGTVIFSPFCIQVIVDLPPGGALINFWPQQDDLGVQVAAGTYTVDVFLPSGPVSTAITIDPAVEAGAITLGPTRIGTTRQVYLTAPQDGGFQYAAAVSGPPVSGGIPTCHGLVPLEMDALLMLSLGPNPFFTNFTGTLSNSGISTLPTITVPNDPALTGLSFYLAFIAIDPTAPCIVRSISAPLVNTIP